MKCSGFSEAILMVRRIEMFHDYSEDELSSIFAIDESSEIGR